MILSLIDSTSVMKGSKVRGPDARFDWDDYYSVDAIYEYLDELAAANADFVRVETVAQTFEGRDIRAILIEKAGPGLPYVFIEASE